ncbi:MAG: beta-glucosidase BglX [Algoriphagus aquaeductus]|uniref:beta-glucosidase BglX n=1 Tax=Algoriphagus aquaeductus TaxID=475299 RepID=UPI0038796456
MKTRFQLFLIFSLYCACSAPKNPSLSTIDHQVDSLLSMMTLEEKIGQMNQYNGFWDVTGPAPAEGDASLKYENLRKGLVGSMLNITGVEEVRKVQKIAVEETRLGIPLLIGFDMIHGMKTMSPIPLAEAASWDMEAIEKSSQIGAREAAAMGINWTFAPMVDIGRDARWGRVMEGAGEDTYLVSQIAKARVRGYQGENLSDPLTLAACVKHFAGYGFSESGRDYNTVEVSRVTLHQVILPPFKAALDAGARTVMNSFNDLDGVPATGNSYLQREILKGKWSFGGLVVSDWGSIGEMVNHRVAKDGKEAAKMAVLAGSDMDMESYLYVSHLKELVESGQVKESLIDDAVRRILRLKFELGLFDNPYLYCDEQREQEIVGSEEHVAGVLEMAKKSIVLLKNEQNLLPLKKSGLNIAVIGALAEDKDSPLGSWRGEADPNSAISVLEGLNEYPDNKYNFAKGADLVLEQPIFLKEVKLNTTDRSGFAQAIQAARSADIVIAVMGENGFQSGEARSRSEIKLPGLQQELLEELVKVNEKIILVSMSGRPLDLSWADEHLPAILQVWHLGSQSGHAIAQVLYGDYNPSGKLPMSFPRNVGQLPLYYNQKSTGRPFNPGDDIVFWSHYSDVPNDALYPFGHGLSYTSFSYSDLRAEVLENQQVKIKVNLKNTGSREGEEVVQLYLHDHFSSLTRPVRELKGFQKISLQPGEVKSLEFLLGKEELGFFDGEGNLQVEPGEFTVMIGGSSKAELALKFEID